MKKSTVFSPMLRSEVSFEQSRLLWQIADEAGVHENATLNGLLYLSNHEHNFESPIYVLRLEDNLLFLQLWCHRNNRSDSFSPPEGAPVRQFDLADPRFFEKLGNHVLSGKP
jgi:hypothetical protein